MTRLAILMVCLVACGKSNKQAAGGSGSGSGSAATVGSGSGSADGSGSAVGSAGSAAGSGSAIAAAAPPCPTDKDLEAKTATWFETKSKLDFVECAAGRFPAPGWVVAARYETTDSNMYTERTAVIDPASGKLLGSYEVEVPPGAIDSSSQSKFQAVDFDKDGIDEIVHVYSSDKRGIMQEILLVDRFENKTFTQVLERQFDYDNEASEPEDGAVSCAAKWTIDPAGADGKRTITFEPTAQVKGKGLECVEQKETWSLAAGGKFTKQ